MPGVKMIYGSLTISVDTSRFDRQYEKAQEYLGNQVLTDCDPYVPFDQGILMSKGAVEEGGREVAWISPYARYQYYGFVMVGKAPKKVTDKLLEYTKKDGHVLAGSHWFEEAKSANLQKWIKEVKRIAGGG